MENSSAAPIAMRRPRLIHVCGRCRTLVSICLLVAVAGGWPEGTFAAQSKLDVGKVRAIHHGLQMQPAGLNSRSGRAQQRLLNGERLETLKAEEASLGFNDGTILAMNQQTELVLQAPELTVVKRGNVAAMDVPGSHFRIQTANATASAIGTLFDVRIAGPSGITYGGAKTLPPGTTTVSVVSGLVVVSNDLGNVRVKAGQWTHVRPGQAPTKPTSHNARADVGWARSLLPGG